MSEEGFTLVELLVALAITAAAAALLSASLWSGGATWRRARADAGGGEEVAAAQALLRGRIERLAPSDEAAVAPPVATSASFGFLAPPPDALRRPGVVANRLALSAGGRLALVAGGAALPLLDGVQRLDIAYWGPAADDPEPRWRARWAEAAPPRLVRIRAGFAPGDRRRWPDLVVRPAVTVAAACRVDPQRGTCA